MENKKIHCFIVGAKGVSFYGGYESFVQKLLQYHKDNKKIQYHVACKANGEGAMAVSKLEGASKIVSNQFTYCNAECKLIKVPEWMGPAQAVIYDIKALKTFCQYIEANRIESPIIYILACRIGPFIKKYAKKIHFYGGKVYLNPDGHEWKRTKWPPLIRRYWKESEKMMIKDADLIICDSINIETYINEEYKKYNPKTMYIAYGAEIKSSSLTDDASDYVNWMKEHKLKNQEFYMICCRAVPENNFETIIREFMKSNTEKDLVIITTKNPRMFTDLENRFHYSRDKRIKFVGTIYNQELLTKIRECAYGYLHGHSVGGTNPALLEALGSTKLNLLYDVGFNKEVAKDAALYWNLKNGNLAQIINAADTMSLEEINKYGCKAKERIRESYKWEKICQEYEKVFTVSL